jgi:hypothetical protein
MQVGSAAYEFTPIAEQRDILNERPNKRSVTLRSKALATRLIELAGERGINSGDADTLRGHDHLSVALDAGKESKNSTLKLRFIAKSAQESSSIVERVQRNRMNDLRVRRSRRHLLSSAKKRRGRTAKDRSCSC